MGSFGERLRREREMRGISLDEIATATKISTRNLRALEDEKFQQLPGGIFNKGFVRAYAKFLGIDEEQMVAEYVAVAQDMESAHEQKLRNDLSKVDFRHDEDDQREISLEPKSQWGTIAVIVLIAVVVFGGWEVYQKKKAERLQQAQVPPPAVTMPAPQTQTPPPTTNNSPATPPASTANTTLTATAAKPPSGIAADATKPASQKSQDDLTLNPALSGTPAGDQSSGTGPIDVKIHANQDSWVSITVDGKTIMKGTLAAASEKAVRAKEQVVVVLGNAGGVEVSYNGKPLEIGKAGEVKKITFTPSGYE